MATVNTDKLDYALGETSIITASGYLFGSTIEFQVQHVIDWGEDGIWGTADDELGYNGGEGHLPWRVVDGGDGDEDGMANGIVKTAWYVGDDSHNEKFRLTALGLGIDVELSTDDELAMSYFTDAGTKEAANLDQWKNGSISNLDPSQDQWVNGNLNGSQAHYSEGEYVPYRTTLSGLDSDTKYWHQFEWDTTVGSGKHALDHLGSYDATFDPLPAGEVYPDPVLGGPGVGDNQTVGSATVTAFDIPDDPRVLAGIDGLIGTSDDIDQSDGVMTLFGGTFDGYALPGANGVFGPITYGNSTTWTTDDRLLRPGADALFNTADDQLVAPGTDGRLGTGDDVVTTSGTSVSIINGADGVLGNADDNNPYTYTGGFAGASTASLVPVITYNGSAEGNAILAWGGHIATRADWGNNNSAAAINGSPFHMRGQDFISQNDSTVSWGNQDRSLQSDAVTFPASITIKKQTDTDGSLQTFDFELTRPTNKVDIFNGYVDLSGDRSIDGQDDGRFVDSGGEIFTIIDGKVTTSSGNGTVNSYFVNSSGLVVSGTATGPVVTALDLSGTGTIKFSLTDNGSITFDNLTDFSSYTIKEIVPTTPQWDLISINRIEIDDINSGDVNDTISNPINDQTVISLTETDQWSLTFNNKLIFVPNAAISILKYTNGIDGPNLNEGETVTWTYFVSNDGNVPLSNVVVSDDHGTPLVPGDDFLPTYVSGDEGNLGFLDPGEIWLYQSEGIADVGLYQNIGKVTGVYAGETLIANDVSSYLGIDVIPTLEVLKKASTNSVPETGANVDFSFTVKNTSGEVVTITSLIDSDYGDLTEKSAAAAALIGTTLAPGASTAAFTITEWVAGDFSGVDHENTFEAKATDDEGNEATASEDETITFTDVLPDISVIKTVDANDDGNALTGDGFNDSESVSEGGVGDQGVVYRYAVTSHNAESVNLTLLDDNKLGDVLNLGTFIGGDADNDGKLGQDETWIYTLAATVPVGDAGASLVNTVTATASDNDGNSDTAQDNATVTYYNVMPVITVVKLVDANKDGTFNDSEALTTVNGKAMYQYVVTNTSTASTDLELLLTSLVDDRGTAAIGDDVNLLTGFSFGSSYGTYYVDGDTNDNYKVDKGESWNFKADLVVPVSMAVPNNTNTVTVIGTDDENSTATDTDTASVKFINYAQITPTGTTVQQYINGTAQNFEDFYASQGGVIQYGVKSGLINNTNPGVFFYYTGLSNTIKGVDGPDAGTAADPLTVFIDQSDNSGLVGAFSLTKNNVKLFKITDLDGNGIDPGDTATQVNLAANQIKLGTGADAGDVTINFTPDAVNSLYVISTMYDTGAVKGANVDTNPTVKYLFNTDVGKDETIEETDVGGITLAPKFAALTLNDDAVVDGHAPTLFDESSAALQKIVDNAISYWAEHGADADQLALLSGTSIKISDLGDLGDGKILGMWSGSEINFDDDAAGYGWSIGLGNVNPNMVDGLSALVHEYGHVLGYEHDVLGESLAVGERDLPEVELVGVTHTPEMFV